MKLWRQGARTPEWWLAAALGFGLIALDLAGQAHRGVADARVLYFLATMTVAVLVGLWAWAWRSPPRMGKLMYLWPVLVVMADLPNAYPDSSVASTIGLATFVFGLIVFAQMALSYPTGQPHAGAPGLLLHLHRRLSRRGDPERREHALLGQSRAAARFARRRMRRR